MNEYHAKRLNEKRRSECRTRQYPKKRSRRRKRHSVFPTVLMGGFLTIAAILYLSIGMRYEESYLPNTTINGIEVSGMDVELVKAAIDSEVRQYVLTIEERGQTEEQIHGADIGICSVFDDTLESVLEEQSGMKWGLSFLKGKDYEIKTMVSYEEEKLASVIKALSCMDTAQTIPPADAYLTYISGSGLQIIPEVQGNEVIPELLLSKVSEAIHNLKSRISLEEAGVYQAPGIKKDNPALKAQAEAWKPYADTTVTYQFGSRTEILDGSTISQWLSSDSQGNVILDEAKAAEYVKGLAKTYNTAYHSRNLKTSYGPTVTITSGHYGWMINQEAETKALLELLYSCQSQEREPLYSQRAASHETPDYGDTYVEMNLTAQHMYFYKNGKLLVESDFVSGNEAKGWSTPAGAYDLTYKQRNAVLKGKNYNTPVNYWMPFNGNIGMHDGYWRSSFGGTIYKKNGSHGCVNLPPSVAKTVYENIEAGIPVLCYHLEGTERAKAATVSGKSAGTESSKPKPKETPVTQPEAPAAESQAKPQETTAEVILPSVEPETAGTENVTPVPQGPGVPESPAENRGAEPITVSPPNLPAGPGQIPDN